MTRLDWIYRWSALLVTSYPELHDIHRSSLRMLIFITCLRWCLPGFSTVSDYLSLFCSSEASHYVHPQERGAHSWIFKFNCYLFCFKVLSASFTNLAGQLWLSLISVCTFNPIFYVLKHLNILILCFVSGKSSTWRVCRSDSAVFCFCWLSCMVASVLICLRNFTVMSSGSLEIYFWEFREADV